MPSEAEGVARLLGRAGSWGAGCEVLAAGFPRGNQDEMKLSDNSRSRSLPTPKDEELIPLVLILHTQLLFVCDHPSGPGPLKRG